MAATDRPTPCRTRDDRARNIQTATEKLTNMDVPTAKGNGIQRRLRAKRHSVASFRPPNVADEPRAEGLQRRVGSICVFGRELLAIQEACRTAFASRGGNRTVFLPLSVCRALAASAILRMS